MKLSLAPVRNIATSTIAEPPDWLLEARRYLRANYPADGLTESLLWALAIRGFTLPAEEASDTSSAA